MKVKELFPNYVAENTDVLAEDTSAVEEDTTAGNMGAAFVDPVEEEEWEGWVDWDQVA